MKIELHILQNFAPSCLNRDDTNAPKDCQFGGFRRARISSQCLKRATRWHPHFAETVGSEIGVRTRRLIGELAHQLVADGKPEEAATEVASALIAALASKVGTDNRTAVGLYVGSEEIARIKEVLIEKWDDLAPEADGEKPDAKEITALKKQLTKEFRDVAGAADIALFGRMVAENADLNIDAACQVAHAISTHKAAMEMDFFTAVDDLQPDEAPGAGMMGTVEFNSSCFYRYAMIDLPQLEANLSGNGHLACRTVDGFLRASVAAIPTGRQNSMAAQNPPSFVMVVVRGSGTPWSLVNAFERPVQLTGRDDKGLVQKSIEALDAYWGRLTGMYGEDGIEAKAACWMDEAEVHNLDACKVANIGALYAAVQEVIAGRNGRDQG
jgi:CRISPR system Cascade subunit CasC